MEWGRGYVGDWYLLMYDHGSMVTIGSLMVVWKDPAMKPKVLPEYMIQSPQGGLHGVQAV